MTTAYRSIREAGWEFETTVGEWNGAPVIVSFHPGWEGKSSRVKVGHLCKRHRTKDQELYLDAWLQHPGHTTSGPKESITVTPSIACDDCDFHGFVTNGEWRTV